MSEMAQSAMAALFCFLADVPQRAFVDFPLQRYKEKMKPPNKLTFLTNKKCALSSRTRHIGQII